MTNQEIFDKTRKIIYENMIQGEINDGQTHFHYTKPSPERYPYQFFWDTCFHVFILSTLGEDQMAKQHLNSLFALQKDDGFVGHMIYWDRLKPGRITDFFQSKPEFKNFYKSHMSNLIQPPIVAQAVERVYLTSGDRKFLENILPKLKKYYRWLSENRDFDGDGLLTIISPFESGMDWKPTFDEPLGFPSQKAGWRLFIKVVGVDFKNFLNNFNLKTIKRKGYFRVKEVGFNSIYIQNLRTMADLCRQLKDSDAARFDELAEAALQSMMKVLYDDKDAAFFDVYGKDDKRIKILTPTIFYPVVIQGMPKEVTEKVMKRHFFNEDEFVARFPIPSVAKSEPSFNPTESKYIWRGPTWIIHNWFMHQFLMERGYGTESEALIRSIKSLIEKGGYREYYNPFTGEGYGAKDFTWAGLVCDMIQMEKDSNERS